MNKTRRHVNLKKHEMSKKRVVLVAGVHEVSGRAASEHWRAVPDTEVHGVSRRSAPVPEGVHPISLDLLNPQDVQQKLASNQGITHIVFGAYIEKRAGFHDCSDTEEMFRTFFDRVRKDRVVP